MPLIPPPIRDVVDYVRATPASLNVISREKSPAGDLLLTVRTSEWRGQNWRNQILYRVPAGASEETCILYITGDGPRDGDFRDIQLLAQASGMPIAMLFDIPNQPIWDMKEDDLIAHTFQKYIETGDPTWPLLFPMVESADNAMTLLMRENPKIKRFVVTGASKRGWTTWLVGALQRRHVAGIAPMVFDNLNFGKQLPRQLSLWREYSPMIQDYIRRGLQTQFATPRGRQLVKMVDPYEYRARLTLPKLIVNGANDPYWATDATRQYLGGLKGPVGLSITPNAGHDLGPKLTAVAAVGAFARSCAGRFPFPTVKARLIGALRVAGGSGAKRVRQWVALPPDSRRPRDFREARYVPSEWQIPGRDGTVRLPALPKGSTASFVEVAFAPDGREFTLCTAILLSGGR